MIDATAEAVELEEDAANLLDAMNKLLNVVSSSDNTGGAASPTAGNGGGTTDTASPTPEATEGATPSPPSVEECHCELLFSAIDATATVTDTLGNSDIERCPVSGFSTEGNGQSSSGFAAKRSEIDGHDSCQLTVVVVEDTEECPFPCAQVCFDDQATNAVSAQSPVDTKETFVSINLEEGCGLNDGETMTITLPCTEDMDIVYLDEETDEYSSDGISDVTECGIDGTLTFTTSHLTVFATAKKIKLGQKHNRNGNLVLSTLAFFTFLYFVYQDLVDLMSLWRDKWANRVQNKRSIPEQVKMAILFALFFHYLHEAALIGYYWLPPEQTQKGSDINSVFSFFIIMPSAFHLWASSIALVSWIEVYEASKIGRSIFDVADCKRILFRINGVIGIIILGAAVSIAVVDDERWFNRIGRPIEVLMGCLVLTMGGAVFYGSQKLVRQIKSAAKRAGRQHNVVVVRKLSISGSVIAICFISYFVVTLISMIREDLYKEFDVIFNAIIKISNLTSFAVIAYLYSPSKQKPKAKRRGPASSRSEVEVCIGSSTQKTGTSSTGSVGTGTEKGKGMRGNDSSRTLEAKAKPRGPTSSRSSTSEFEVFIASSTEETGTSSTGSIETGTEKGKGMRSNDSSRILESREKPRGPASSRSEIEVFIESSAEKTGTSSTGTVGTRTRSGSPLPLGSTLAHAFRWRERKRKRKRKRKRENEYYNGHKAP